MKNLLRFAVLLFVGLSVFSCGDQELNPQDNQSTEIQQLTTSSILGADVSLVNQTFGKNPNSEVFSTTFYSGQINSKEMDQIVSSSVKTISKPDQVNWIFIYSKERNYDSSLDVDTDNFKGIGVCYVVDNKYQFELFNSDFERVLNYEYGNDFPTRIFELYKKEVDANNEINSTLFIYNESPKQATNQNGGNEYDKDLKVLDKLRVTNERDCGCQALPCCDVDGCGWEESLTYCGWEDDGFGGTYWACKSCGTFDNCSSGLIADDPSGTVSAKQMSKDSRKVRDQLLYPYQKGKDYIELYYSLENIIDVEELMSKQSTLKNWLFAYNTLKVSERLLYGDLNEVIVDFKYHNKATNLLNLYKSEFADNEEFTAAVNTILTDLNKYKGWTKQAVLADVEDE